MIDISFFNNEMRVLEARFRTKLRKEQKDLFFVAIRSALTNWELRTACDRIVDSDAIVFPSPSDVIKSAWKGNHRIDSGFQSILDQNYSRACGYTPSKSEISIDDLDEWEEI
jgi:hypothetical protein